MISVVIQAGGKSVRMGSNKALLPFLGRPLIQRVADRLAGLTDDLLVIAPAEPDLLALGFPVHPDLIPGAGPLGGLLTGLRFARHEAVAVVACDMPFANAALLTEELQILIADNADVVLPVTADLAEPLHALYRRSTCLPAVTAALAGGQRRLVDFHPAVRVIKMRESNTLEPAAFARSFLNLNTPQELADAEQLAVSHPEW